MGLIVTMVALVLGLVAASAKSSYDTQSSELEQVSATIVQLDQLLDARVSGSALFLSHIF